MEIDLSNIKITVKQNCTETTKKYVSILSQILNKGINNPAFQLHVLCVIHLGKTFNDVVYADNKRPSTEDMINLIKTLPLNLIAKNIKVDDSGRPDITETTIEDILKAQEEKEKGDKENNN